MQSPKRKDHTAQMQRMTLKILHQSQKNQKLRVIRAVSTLSFFKGSCIMIVILNILFSIQKPNPVHNPSNQHHAQYAAQLSSNPEISADIWN